MEEAAWRGTLEEVKRLVADESDIDATFALHNSCANGRLEIAAFLIEAGADVNKLDDNGCTPLYYCCLEGHVEIARLLLQKGANPNVEMGQLTILHESCYHQRIEIIKLLLIYKADSWVLDYRGRTAFSYLTRQQCEELAVYFNRREAAAMAFLQAFVPS